MSSEEKQELELREFISAGFSDLSKMAEMLKQNPDLIRRQTSKVGETALIYLATENATEAVRFLWAHGADINETNSFGETSLMMAASLGHVELVKFLLERGANVHAADGSGDTALHRVGNEDNPGELVDTLVAAGAEVDVLNNTDETPLFWAACRGNCQVVERLLVHGANVHARALFDETPMHQIGNGPVEELVDLLLRYGAEIGARAEDGSTPIHNAAFSLSPRAVKVLLDRGANKTTLTDEGKSPVDEARRGFECEIIRDIQEREERLGAVLLLLDPRTTT